MRKQKFFLTLILLILAVAGTFGQAADNRKLPNNYVSDKCSWFPDGNYGDCCVAHDKTYFFGGTKKDRRVADNALSECVKGKGHRFISKMMWLGVRIGGVGFLPTSFRWGFGNDWDIKHPAAKKK